MKGGDFLAGMSVAGLMLPQAIAYAGIAGLPPGRAVLATIAGSLAYALIGRSRFAIVSPTSSSAAILAATLAVMPGDASTRAALATVAVAMAGALFLAAGALRLGDLTSFIARPVLHGFTFGLAITIILRQLPVLVGVDVPAPNILALLVELLRVAPRWHMASLATGLVALIALVWSRRAPALPGALLVLLAGILAAVLLDLPAHGVATVGEVRLEPGWPDLASLSFAPLSRLAQMVVPLALILFAESWATMRGFAVRHGETLAPDRELGALGLANLAAAALRGMPVGAGFSAGAAAEAAGAPGRATGVVAALALALVMIAAPGLVAMLPQPVLAAVVIAALTHTLDPAPLLRLWRLDRDQYVALGAAIGVILLGVLDGMLLAILLSLAAMIHRMASPHLVELGRLGAHDFVDIARHPEAARVPGLSIWRPVEPLFFANAERVLAEVERRLDGAAPARLVLSLEESFDIDSSALDALIEFDQRVTRRGWTLTLARVHDHVRDLLARAGATALAERSSYSVDDAVTSSRGAS